jgi:hypothetical protein
MSDLLSGTGTERCRSLAARSCPGERSSHAGRATLALVLLVPVAVSLLACGGLVDTPAGLGDTGDPLVVPVTSHQGSGDGAPSGSTARPSLLEKIAKVPHARPPGTAAQPDGPTEDPDAPDEPVPGPAEPEGIRGVKQTGPRAWTVKERVADRWQDDPYDLASVEPHGDGWMLHRVRKKDAYHLGMRNKDVILSVNGRKLKTQAQLLAAYLALKNKKDFEVVFLRKGKQMKHTYRIR